MEVNGTLIREAGLLAREVFDCQRARFSGTRGSRRIRERCAPLHDFGVARGYAETALLQGDACLVLEARLNGGPKTAQRDSQMVQVGTVRWCKSKDSAKGQPIWRGAKGRNVNAVKCFAYVRAHADLLTAERTCRLWYETQKRKTSPCVVELWYGAAECAEP